MQKLLSRRRSSRRAAVLTSLLALVLPLAAPGSAAADPPPPARWTAATADVLVEQAVSNAARGGSDALARLVLATAIAAEASAGLAQERIAALASGPGSGSPGWGALADQARWLAAHLEAGPSRLPWPGLANVSYEVGPDPQGLVRTFAILGPFEDTGGGLLRAQGPETPDHDFRTADYSWGAYAVRSVRSVPATCSARGLPLDLYIHPRSESCTYSSAVVEAPVGGGPVVLHVASAGAFRLFWDGVAVAHSEEIHPAARLDRAAVRIAAAPGDHLVTLKVCSGARRDSGHVRLRLTSENHEPLPLATSSDPRRLQAVQRRLRAAASSPARVVPVPTMLEQSLAIGESPTAEQLLTAAVLRTLGGAEDLRRPHAPGLLDSLVGTGTVSPDHLAMAGAITPSAANRSGWLEQALEQASAASDGETVSFALRELVRSRLRARLADAAYDTARRAPLAAATDAQAGWLRARTLIKLDGSGLSRTALAAMRELAQQLGERTPTVVWQTIATRTEYRLPPVHLAAMRELSQRRPGSRGSRYVRAFRMAGAAELGQAAAGVLLLQRDARELSRIGQLLLSAGRYGLAAEAFGLATTLCPNRSAGHRGLARALLAGQPDGAQHERALTALERAQELQPHSAALKAELAYRRGGRARDGADAKRQTLDDTSYLVAPEVFLARAQQVPMDVARQSARQLHWRRVVVLHPDKRVSQLMHYAREVVIEPRTETERYERLPLGRGPTELVLARVHRAAGAVVLAPEEQDTPEGAPPSVRWPKLQRGDVVEVAVRTWTPGPVGRRGDAPFYFVDYSGSRDTHPLLYNEIVVDAPIDGPLAFDVIGGKADRTLVTDQDGRRTTRLIWDTPPTIRDEPLAPPLSEVVPVIAGSAFPTWKAFEAWYLGAVKGFTEPDDQIRRLAAELTQSKAGRELSRDEKIEALFDFVADDIRYVNYRSGEWWLPNRPQQLLARRQGDCDDKAMLLISLLRAVGIEAVEALIQTRYTRQPSVLQSTRVAIPMFDHGIVFLPGRDGEADRWLDATSPQSRVGPLPSMDARAMALLLGKASMAEVAVVPTPAGTAAEYGVDATWTLTLTPSGAGDLQATEKHLGDSALILRSHLQEADARAQWVERHLLAGWFPTVRIDPEVSFDGELPGGAARLSYHAHSRSAARREGRDLVVTLAPPMPLTAGLAPLVTRTLPVVLPARLAPRHEKRTIRVVAPAGFEFAELPPDAIEDGGDFGSAQVSFTRSRVRGRPSVTIQRDVSFEQSRIEVDEYDQWRSWLQRIDRLVRRGLRLVPR